MLSLFTFMLSVFTLMRSIQMSRRVLQVPTFTSYGSGPVTFSPCVAVERRELEPGHSLVRLT